MKRRAFITLISGAVVWPVVARAQQPAALPTIGFLGAYTASASVQRQWTDAFVQRLRELGWVEGRDVAILYRWGEGRSERSAEILAEFVRLNVDVIVTHSTPLVLAAKQATSAIPIVFSSAADPVGNGLVASLARPGGNVTGLSNQTVDLAGKRLELLREVVPRLGRLAILASTIGNPASALELSQVQGASKTLGLEAITLEIRGGEDIAPALQSLQDRADALYVVFAPVLTANPMRINTLALGGRLPTIYANRESVAAGGLMSYGPSTSDSFRRAGDFVDKILRGAKPANIPVEQPTKFELVVNLTAAKALGLDIPPTLLARADAVIE